MDRPEPASYMVFQKFFPIAYLILGARRAVPSSLWAWLAMPQNEIIFGNRYSYPPQRPHVSHQT
jgi:hypothetical protein